jgi:uncharacterized protein (DUF433 family)
VSMVIQTDPVPLRLDESGALRVGTSRVLYELVLAEFKDGSTPETIVQRYDTLSLPDVYAVISYYLHHEAEVEDYLRQREEEADRVRRMIEANQPPLRPGLREELLARRAQREKGDVAPGN